MLAVEALGLRVSSVMFGAWGSGDRVLGNPKPEPPKLTSHGAC